VSARIVIAALGLVVVAGILRGESAILAAIGGGLTFVAAAVVLGVLRPRDLLTVTDVLLAGRARRPAGAQA
jgi:hypothetical protein